jgi:hypothetical protein
MGMYLASSASTSRQTSFLAPNRASVFFFYSYIQSLVFTSFVGVVNTVRMLYEV